MRPAEAKAVEEWERLEILADSILNGFPLSSMTCSVCHDALKDKLKPDITLHEPALVFLHAVERALTQWLFAEPIVCDPCEEEEMHKEMSAY